MKSFSRLILRQILDPYNNKNKMISSSSVSLREFSIRKSAKEIFVPQATSKINFCCISRSTVSECNGNLINDILTSKSIHVILHQNDYQSLCIKEIQLDGKPISLLLSVPIAKESSDNHRDTKLALINMLVAGSGLREKQFSDKLTFDVSNENNVVRYGHQISFQVPCYAIDDGHFNGPGRGLDQFDMIIDVRSPGEFEIDHIPGAINLPVLNNEERSKVGELYSADPTSARGIGAAIISRSISEIVESHFLNLKENTKILVYCWRGGLRSKSLALVLQQIKFKYAVVLTGGYKKFRKHVISSLPLLINSHEFRVLGGNTGSGKSLILECMAEEGEQVLHLEAIALHKGSILGQNPLNKQPSQKRFETSVWNVLRKAKPTKKIFVEKEGGKIGILYLPKELTQAILKSPSIFIDVNLDTRVNHLLRDYKYFLENPQDLMPLLDLFIKHNDQKRIEKWKLMLRDRAFLDLVKSLLVDHYDPTYKAASAKDSIVTRKSARFEWPSHLELEKHVILESNVIKEMKDLIADQDRSL